MLDCKRVSAVLRNYLGFCVDKNVSGNNSEKLYESSESGIHILLMIEVTHIIVPEISPLDHLHSQ